MCYTVTGKANMVLDYTRMKNFVKQGKIPLSRHQFWLCFEVDRNRSTRVDLLRPYRVFIAKVMNARYFFAHIGLLGAGILLFLLSVKTLISSFYASLFILARNCKRNGIGIFSYICGIPIVQCNGNEKLGQIGAIKITANNFSFSFAK